MRVVRDSKGKRKDVRASIERNDAKCIEKKGYTREFTASSALVVKCSSSFDRVSHTKAMRHPASVRVRTESIRDACSNACMTGRKIDYDRNY
jgi:hypothetical protein